jgi:HSP20 family molecular chaperone IbpA
VLKVELAGVRADKVAIHYSATKHSLTIKGWRSDTAVFPNEKQSAHLLEIEYGEFWREVQLPDVMVKVEEVKASFRTGMLLLAIPKSTEAPTTLSVRKVITIQKL